MKPVLPLAALIIAGLGVAPGEDAVKSTDPGLEMKALEKSWSEAVVKRDVPAIDRILADDYVLTTPEGRLVTKAQIIESFRAPADPSYVLKSIDLAEMTVRFFGETALVSSRFTLNAEADGAVVATPFRHSDVFVRRHGAWRCEARQATRIRQSYGQVNPAGGKG